MTMPPAVEEQQATDEIVKELDTTETPAPEAPIQQYEQAQGSTQQVQEQSTQQVQAADLVQQYGFDQGRQEQIQTLVQRASTRVLTEESSGTQTVVRRRKSKTVFVDEQPEQTVVRRRKSKTVFVDEHPQEMVVHRVMRSHRQVVDADEAPEVTMVRRRSTHTQHYETHKSVTVMRLRRIITELREAKQECISKTGAGSVFSKSSIVEDLDGAHEESKAPQPQPEPSTSDLSKLFGTSVNLDANVKAIEEME